MHLFVSTMIISNTNFLSRIPDDSLVDRAMAHNERHRFILHSHWNEFFSASFRIQRVQLFFTRSVESP